MVNFKQILVPLDGSGHASKAARVAVDIASKYDARLTFLTVTKEFKVSKQIRRFMELENLTGEPSYLIDEMTKTILDEAKDYARAQGLKGFKAIVREGLPARVIINYAKDHKIDLIVMGSRGLGDVEGTLLGSVSHKVANLAGCMVTTVK